eukprot:4453425-Pyramimonas_sp.AAC.1
MVQEPWIGNSPRPDLVPALYWERRRWAARLRQVSEDAAARRWYFATCPGGRVHQVLIGSMDAGRN